MINFIQNDRFYRFVDNLCIVAARETSKSYVDLSPNDIFDGEIGTLLVKNGKDIFYKKSNEETFTNLSEYFSSFIESRAEILNSGINKRATWVKNSKFSEKKWKLVSYTCPFSSLPCKQCVSPASLVYSYYYY